MPKRGAKTKPVKVCEIMSPAVETINPDETLRTVADLMRRLDVGSLPVCENDRLCGIVTDRDIVVRGLAAGLDPDQASVREVMTEGIFFAFENQNLKEAAEMMQKIQIRRLPVLNSKKRLVGIITLKNLADQQDKDELKLVGRTIRKICDDAA